MPIIRSSNYSRTKQITGGEEVIFVYFKEKTKQMLTLLQTMQQPTSDNLSHDNFGVPLNGYGNDVSAYGNDATARQDFDDGLTTTSGVLNADSFSEFDSG